MPISIRMSVAIFLVCPSLVTAQSKFSFFEPVAPVRKVQVVVAEGSVPGAPVNSPAVLDLCAKDSCEWLELTVRLTKDRQHVICRDETVDSTTNGTGRVADLTLAELKQFDAGSWYAKRFAGAHILTLRDALDAAREKLNLKLNCQLIDPALLAKEISEAKMQNQVVLSGEPSVLSQVKAVGDGTIAVMAKFRHDKLFDDVVKATSPAAVEIDASDVTTELCQQFHAAGRKVLVQLNSASQDHPEIWAKVIDSGADWIHTDKWAEFLFFSARRQFGKFPVMIACHRGANRYAPENTIPAIQEAAALGVDFTEIDIRTTKDGRTVLVHDSTVNRTTNGQGPVRSLTFAEITALSAGAWFGKPFEGLHVPSFDEGLEVYGEKMGAYLDAKDIAPELLIAAIKKYNLTERHVVYQSLGYCEKLSKLDPTVRPMPPLKGLADLEKVAATKPYAVDAAWSGLSAELITECHRYNIKVFSDALGPNESIERYRMAIGWGIDCIQTDHPLRVLRAVELVMAERGSR